MKPLTILTFVVLASLRLNAQITLEQTYPDAGYNHSVQHDQFFLWDFEASGMKYVKIDRTALAITLYNLDHTQYKFISFADAPATVSTPYIMYLSEHLFDLDDDVEYLYSSFGGAPESLFTRVYDEDGTVLLNADSCSLFVYSTVHQQQFPIMNTPQGAKLILSHWSEASARVYRLPGTLACPACEDEVAMAQGEGSPSTAGIGTLQIHPNPAQESVTVQYALPPGADVGELVVVDESGRTVFLQALQRGSDKIVLGTGTLAKGSYHCFLRAPQGIILGPSSLVIH